MENMISKQQDHNGKTYFITERRGVSYRASMMADGTWQLTTNRLALGRMNAGGCKYFESIKDLAASCKAFSGLDVFMGGR